MQRLEHACELLAIDVAIGHHVGLVAPGGGADFRDMHRHGGAVVSPIEQKPAQNVRVASDEPGTQPGQVRPFRQTVKDDTAAVIVATQRGAGLQEAGRRPTLVAIDFAVALIRRDDEIELVCLGDERVQRSDIQYRACWIAWRAQVNELRAGPDVVRHRTEVGQEAIVLRAMHEVGRRPRQQRRAFVDLVEGIGHEHDRVRAVGNQRLRKREQRLAGAVHRQHVACGLQAAGCQVEAPGCPFGAGGAQVFAAPGRGIGAQRAFDAGRFAQRRDDEVGGRVLRLAKRQRDVRRVGLHLDTGLDGIEALKGIGVECVQSRIHRGLTTPRRGGGRFDPSGRQSALGETRACRRRRL